MSGISDIVAAGQAIQLAEAVQEWQALLGREHVVTDSAALRAAETTTFSTEQHVPVIIRPGNREEVQECLRIANRFRVPVYPVSTGLNYGYGSSVPTADSCALMHLGRMNRILDFSEELAYVTVEPGVTQAQLFQFLKERNSQLWLDASGGHPNSSILGNTVERGFGHTPYGDHFANSCAYEVVLPTGECIGTGFARFEGAKTAPCYRWGVGPTVDGIFTQSNFGVVTRMTVWLMPAPEHFEAFYFRVDRDDQLGTVINALRPLRLNNTLRSAMHIVNDYKVMSAMHQYPYDVTNGETPLRPEVMKTFRKQLSCGAWNGSGALYGTKGQVAEARRAVKRALAGKVDKLQFLDDFKLELAGRFSKPFSWVSGWDLSGALELVRPVYGLTKGIPTDHPLKSCYWRHRQLPEKFGIDDGACGMLWCSPVAPLDGAHTEAIVRIAYDVILAAGFEPMLSITLLTERSASCIFTIIYDRRVPGEDEKALACHKRLLERFAAEGYHSYRLGIQAMSQMQGDPAYTEFLQRLKSTLDPNQVLSPGRYVPTA